MAVSTPERAKDSPEPLDYSATAAPLAPTPVSHWSWVLAAVVTLAGAVLPAVLWPGDISWINDEPRLLANAYYATQHHMLAPHGLKGNFGITYGPVATQIYQALLLVTHDPLTLVVIRAGLCAGVTALSLLWLARSLRLNPWFAAAVALAPFLWVFHRIMWDASFALPFGMLALAAYASFLRTGSGGPLVLSLFCALLLPFIHPQDVPLAAPIGLHLLWKRHRDLLRHWIGVLVVTGLVYYLNRRYLPQVIQEVKWHFTGEAERVYPNVESHPTVVWMLMQLLGGRILGGHGYMDGEWRWEGIGVLVRAGKLVSHLVYGLIWVGIPVAAWRCFHRGRRRDGDGEQRQAADGPRPKGPARWDAERTKTAVGGIALAGLVLQVLIFGLKHVPPDPQYFFGTFPIFVVFAWLAVDALAGVRAGPVSLGGVLIGAYGLSVAAITLGSLWHAHFHMPGKDLLHPPRAMPTLALQVELARALNRYTDDTALTDVPFFKDWPQALRGLRLLLPPEPGTPRRESGRLLIRYGDGPGGPETRLEVVELETDADIPPDAEEMEITPLPEGWEPPG